MRHFLHVEDNEDIRKAIARFFKINYPQDAYLSVATSKDAIEALSKAKFSIVLSDYDLGDGGTGAEVLNWLEDNQPDMLQRFIFLSGSPEVQALHPIYLDKPASNEAIKAEMDKIFTQDQPANVYVR